MPIQVKEPGVPRCCCCSLALFPNKTGAFIVLRSRRRLSWSIPLLLLGSPPVRPLLFSWSEISFSFSLCRLLQQQLPPFPFSCVCVSSCFYHPPNGKTELHWRYQPLNTPPRILSYKQLQQQQLLLYLFALLLLFLLFFRWVFAVFLWEEEQMHTVTPVMFNWSGQ